MLEWNHVSISATALIDSKLYWVKFHTGNANSAQAALDAARSAADRADDLVDDDNGRDVAAANALSGDIYVLD